MAGSGITAGKVVLYGFLGAGALVGGACLACAMLVGRAAHHSASAASDAPTAVAPAAAPREPTYEERRQAVARREADAITAGLAAARAQQKPLPASKLAGDYQKNELAADQRYKDGWWKIEGVVERVGKDIGDSPYITLRGRSFSSVQCFLEGDSAAAAVKLERGDLIEVAGQVTGLMMNVVVKHCEFL
jgi:tRNA_anti-like